LVFSFLSWFVCWFENLYAGVFGSWFGLVWFGLVWFGLVWFGLVWCGVVWFGFVISSTFLLLFSVLFSVLFLVF
jgi:hypothetical protein